MSNRARKSREQKWVCRDDYCKKSFETLEELEFHQLAQHKTRIRETATFSDSKVQSKQQHEILDKKKKRPLLDRLKDVFTSETTKKKNPPVENIRFQCYSPKNTLVFNNNNSKECQNDKNVQNTQIRTTSPSVPKTYASLRSTQRKIAETEDTLQQHTNND